MPTLEAPVLSSVWQNLAEFDNHRITTSTAADVVGLVDVKIIEVCTTGIKQEIVVNETVVTDSAQVQSWLKKTHESPDGSVVLRLLLGHRVIVGDGLRPPPDALGIQFSRKQLCTTLNISAMALSKLSSLGSWTLTFPADCYTPKCTGYSQGDFGIAWSQRPSTRSISAFVVCYGHYTADNFIQILNATKIAAPHQLFMPFTIACTSLAHLEQKILVAVEQGSTTERDIMRAPGRRDANDIFARIAARTNSVEQTRLNAEMLQQMTRDALRAHEEVQAKRLPIEIAPEDHGLSRGLDYIDSALAVVIKVARNYQEQTNRQLTTVLSMMATQEQQRGIELTNLQTKLAKASTDIAADSKRDSSSMKTLAVVTMVFLPGTSVATLLAIPAFDWHTGKGMIINSDLWIYFVLTIPLTVLTILSWYFWQRWREGQRGENDVELLKI